MKQDIPYSDDVCKCWLHIPKEIVTEGKIAHLHVLIMKQFSYLLRNVPIVLTIDDYVLPPSQSLSIIRDNDLIMLRKLNFQPYKLEQEKIKEQNAALLDILTKENVSNDTIGSLSQLSSNISHENETNSDTIKKAKAKQKAMEENEKKKKKVKRKRESKKVSSDSSSSESCDEESLQEIIQSESNQEIPQRIDFKKGTEKTNRTEAKKQLIDIPTPTSNGSAYNASNIKSIEIKSIQKKGKRDKSFYIARNMAYNNWDRRTWQPVQTDTAVLQSDEPIPVTSTYFSNLKKSIKSKEQASNVQEETQDNPKKRKRYSAVLTVPEKQYKNYSHLNREPNPGDIIAYKILELTPNMTPELSKYKEAKVLQFDKERRIVLLKHLFPPVEIQKILDSYQSNPLDEIEQQLDDRNVLIHEKRWDILKNVLLLGSEELSSEDLDFISSYSNP